MITLYTNKNIFYYREPKQNTYMCAKFSTNWFSSFKIGIYIWIISI